MLDNHDPNPYRAMTTDASSPLTSVATVDFAPILHRWEKYRLWFNGILIVNTMLWTVILNSELLLDGLFWFHLCVLGAFANLCFFIGPALDGYGRYFGLWNSLMSLVLFLLGLALTGVFNTLFLWVRTR